MKLNPVFDKYEIYFMFLNYKEKGSTKRNRRFTKIDIVIFKNHN